ncbi:hypothetical protein LDL05_01110 [Nonomuraea cavernae]|uniref:glutamate-cysteine ligase family protein n=1 Tax=Nonomuraea cavernae TaxID=2045107 RepID=UPI00166DB746|nr:glutamate-cysteine ligase family protein [Nonomuraea cavernae]MCA2183669.1 hypothetical protein [Nonomuraea cavernae]
MDLPLLLRTNAFFAGTDRERVGMEVELAAVDERTGRCVPYAGQRGLRRVLERVRDEWTGEASAESGYVTAVRRSDGACVSLEMGGAIEYASPPADTVHDLATRLGRDLGGLAAMAAEYGVALLPGGNFPFNTSADITWLPRRRAELLKAHYARVAPHAGYEAMTLNLSAQVTLDYLGPVDLARKLRMQALVAPVVHAILVNSPLFAGRPSGLLSRRMHQWQRAEPVRWGPLRAAWLADDEIVAGFVDWAGRLPMIYRRANGTYEPGPDLPFRDLVSERGMSSEQITEAWRQHLDQIWTDVRLRRTLELRGADGPPAEALPAVAALWAGLSYHRPSRAAASGLLSRSTPRDYVSATGETKVAGLAATYGGRPMRELAVEIVRLARNGLEERAAQGLEKPGAARLLEPLEEVVDSGLTYAERTLRGWDGRCDRYVRHFRIKDSL